MNDLLKKIIKENENIFAFIYNLFNWNNSHISKGNFIKTKGVFLKKTNIKIKGQGNVVKIEGNLTRLYNCTFYISGNNNTIDIGGGGLLCNVIFFIEDDNGMISIGEKTTITGKTQLAVIEGCSISIGRNCLFSQNITFRTGGSHSIIDLDGHRINPSKDIVIGDHVWIGHTVILLKGTNIGDNSIVATGSIITGGKYPSNSIIGGIGGKILKSGVNWCSERIPIV